MSDITENNKVVLQLEIMVEYNSSGVAKEELATLLADIANRAAGDGLMTGETAAEVETWWSHVKDMDTGEYI